MVFRYQYLSSDYSGLNLRSRVHGFMAGSDHMMLIAYATVSLSSVPGREGGGLSLINLILLSTPS